jgi:catechol 2,3-dioxygenase-like lactoylglutathione lyase family enzyme
MKTQELHRGRLIDHIQLVVKDLSASQKFYTAISERFITVKQNVMYPL